MYGAPMYSRLTLLFVVNDTHAEAFPRLSSRRSGRRFRYSNTLRLCPDLVPRTLDSTQLTNTQRSD